MATKDNSTVPNPPKAAQRGGGLLNPPKATSSRNSITPPPPESDDAGMPVMDDSMVEDSAATARLQVGWLRQPVISEEPSKTEPLMLRNIRLAPQHSTAQAAASPSEAPPPRAAPPQSRSRVTAPVARKRPLAYDLDEDAVTKKIVINRIVTVSPDKRDPQRINSHLRIETVDAHGAGGVPVTTGEFRNPMESDRPTDLSALGKATQAAQRRSLVLPTLRSGLRKVLAIFSGNAKGDGFGNGRGIIDPSSNQYNLGANSYSAELYKEMRQAAKSGIDFRNSKLPVPRFTYLVSRPPRIVLKGFLVRREKATSLMLRGRAIHPLCVRDVMVFADKKKVLYLSSAARNDAGCIEFSADIPLTGETSHILVVARHNEEVMGSQSLYVRKDDYPHTY